MSAPSRRRRTFWALLLPLALAACGGDDTTDATDQTATSVPADRTDGSVDPPTQPADGGAAGGTLTVAASSDPISLNPRAYSFNSNLYITRQIVDSLVAQDPASGEIQPWLATSWEIDETATTFTFTLRDDVTFSDGTPLTADVVKANFDDITANAAQVNPAILGVLPGFEGTTVIDESTVEVTFGQPSAPFIQALSEPGFGIVAQATLDLPWEARADAVIGTGPFTLESYTPNGSVVLARRNGYGWAPQSAPNQSDALLDEVVFQIVPEPSIRTGGLQTGEFDVITDVLPEDIELLRGDGLDVVARSSPGTPNLLVVTSSDRSPLDELDVRRAISLAIDRVELRDTVLTPDYLVATSALSSTTPGYADLSVELTHDAEQAAALLDAAGWIPGADGICTRDGERLSIVVSWPDLGGYSENSLLLISDQLRRVGVELEVLRQSNTELLDGLANVAYDLFWTANTRADGDALSALSAAPPNYYNIHDQDLQDLLAEQAAAADPGARAEVLEAAQERVIAQVVAIPIVESTAVFAAAPTVHGLQLDAASRLPQLTAVSVS